MAETESAVELSITLSQHKMNLSSSSSSSSTSSSWSDLPLDLLIIIREKLKFYQRIDLISFRSVCSQWRSAMPVPSSLPRYAVIFCTKYNVVHFTNNSRRCISVSLPFHSSPIYLFRCSNGWIVFISHNDNLHLLDPVSNRRLIFPRMTPKLLRHHKKLKPGARKIFGLSFKDAVVSSSTGGGVAVAAIVKIEYEECNKETRLAFCRYGDGQSWSLFMEESKDIHDIVVAGDGRFYAIDKDWELYMLDERPPTIRLKRFKLMLPKHILEPDLKNDPTEERAIIRCCYMQESGGSELKIYGNGSRRRIGGNFITLKLDLSKISRSSYSVNVGCEAEWSDNWYCADFHRHLFTPILKPSIKI